MPIVSQSYIDLNVVVLLIMREILTITVNYHLYCHLLNVLMIKNVNWDIFANKIVV
jgi:hypothetical protein